MVEEEKRGGKGEEKSGGKGTERRGKWRGKRRENCGGKLKIEGGRYENEQRTSFFFFFFFFYLSLFETTKICLGCTWIFFFLGGGDFLTSPTFDCTWLRPCYEVVVLYSEVL